MVEVKISTSNNSNGTAIQHMVKYNNETIITMDNFSLIIFIDKIFAKYNQILTK